MRLDDALPFVLLDDARPAGGPARLYRAPVDIVRADAVGDVAPALAQLRAGLARGLKAAGFLSYDAGPAFERHLASHAGAPAPLLWFGLFDGHLAIPADDVPALLPPAEGAFVGVPRPTIDRDRYAAMLDQVLDLIRAGDIYQANLTFSAQVPLLGHPLAAYAQLRARSAAGYGAIVATGDQTLLSLSPELFFTLDHGTLTAKPMKGTARRGETAAQDAENAASLREDAKQRAENLMIVDLLRNDLSRVARAGSVTVPDLFAIESYPTVHQMVSTVQAALAPGKDAIDVIDALFPCGSITGAPKIRAMEILAAVEAAPARGVYTGAIGRIDANGAAAAFNVAIRTLTVSRGAAHASVGLGSGIVADSRADAEWDECLAKAAFLPSPRQPDLIETMRYDPHQGVLLLERHLARMKASAQAMGYAFDRHAARNELQVATFALAAPARVRLVLGPSGAIAIETQPLPADEADPVAVAIVPLPVDPSDYRLRHKTSDRAFYDGARRAAGVFEVLFALPDGRLTEGSFTSLFVPRDDTLLTPPAELGLLPGILRAELIETGQAREAVLTADDLAGGFLIGNALRGLMPARLVAGSAKPGL